MNRKPFALSLVTTFALVLVSACGGSGGTNDGGTEVHVDFIGPRVCTGNPCVSTVAGSGGMGNTDGKAMSAQFSFPHAVAVDAAGNRYEADTYGNRILKITPEGISSVFAGTGEAGDDDGDATSASFSMPTGLALGVDGALYVTDMGSGKIRRITLG